MTYANMVAGTSWWPVQAARPVRRFPVLSVPQAALPALEAWSRIASGAAIGGTFGLTTSYALFWLVAGAGIATAYGKLRDRYHVAEIPTSL